MLKKNFIQYLPNMLTGLRIILSLPLIYCLFNPGNEIVSIVLVIIAVFSDLLDGALARFLNVKDGFGKMFDPIADAVFIFSLLFGMTIKGDLPVWFFTLVLLRYMFVGYYSLKLYCYGFTNLASNWEGKCSACGCMIIISLYFLQYIIPFYMIFFLNYLIIMQSIILIVSWRSYYLRYIKMIYLNT